MRNHETNVCHFADVFRPFAQLILILFYSFVNIEDVAFKSVKSDCIL